VTEHGLVFILPTRRRYPLAKSQNTHISNRFEYWSVADCACEYCQFYIKKGRSCKLETCCCSDIREEAIKRETTANAAHTGGVLASNKGGAA